MLEKLRVDNNALGRVGRNIFMFLGLLFFIIALARPAVYDAKVEIKQMRSTLFVLFDISASMRGDDYFPNRLEMAKAKFDALIAQSDLYDIGVGAFAHDFFLVSPITNDKNILHYFVKNLDFTSLSRSGTDMHIALEGAQRVLKEQKEKTVLIFSDGGDAQNFDDAIAYAKEHHIRVYIDALASAQGAPIKVKGSLVKDAQGNIVISKRNENFKTLALESDGAYIDAGIASDDITQLMDKIRANGSAKKESKRDALQYKEFFYVPLGLGILFLLIAFTSLPRRRLGEKG